jgi:peroxiredoxin
VRKAGIVSGLVAGSLALAGTPPEIGRPAPGFELATLDGGRASLADRRGHAVVVTFWASWCEPCRHELPDIVLRYHELHRYGLEVLAVDLSDQERPKDIRRFADEFRLPFPILLDVEGKVRRRYRLLGLPTTVFIDSMGMVAGVHTGPMTPSALDRGIAVITRFPRPD